MKIKCKPKVVAVKYYGYHQGYKVYICGKKYPRKYGYFYATNDREKAIEGALAEYMTERRKKKK